MPVASRALVLFLCIVALAWRSDARADVSWSDPVAVDTGVTVLAAGEGNVLTFLNGRFWVVYEKNGDIYATSRTAQGWQPPVRLTTNASVQTRPRIAADADYAYVIWEDWRGTRPEIWTRRYNGNTWLAEQALTANDGVASRFPTLGASEYGAGALAAWEDSTAGGFRVYRSTYSAGQWTAPEPITGNAAGQRHPSVASRGGAMVAWEDYRHGDAEIYQRSSVQGGWLDEERVSDWPWPCTHPSAGADFYDIWFAPFVAFEAGTASGGAEIRIQTWSGNESQISAEDAIPSRRPNTTQFVFTHLVCNQIENGYMKHQVAWTDILPAGAREHYVWEGAEGAQSTPGDGISYSGIAAQHGEPLAQLAQAWIEDRSGVYTLVARVGTTVGCNTLEIQGTQALLVAPEGIPVNLVRTVNSCDGSPRQEYEMSFSMFESLETQLEWDPGYWHESFMINTDEDGEARIELRGGGCATFGNAVIGCGWQAEHVWTGAKSPDVNGDCRVRPDDLAYVQSKIGTADFCADLDESGVVGAEDVAIVEATMWDHCSHLAGVDDALAAQAPGLHASPNPATGTVRIIRSGPVAPGERLAVFDAGGRRIREESLDAATATRTWDLRDGAGRRIAAGLYFIVVQSNAVRLTAPIIVLE